MGTAAWPPPFWLVLVIDATSVLFLLWKGHAVRYWMCLKKRRNAAGSMALRRA